MKDPSLQESLGSMNLAASVEDIPCADLEKVVENEIK
jgi:hypothetical protein